jgi:hypothetical protein
MARIFELTKSSVEYIRPDGSILHTDEQAYSLTNEVGKKAFDELLLPFNQCSRTYLNRFPISKRGLCAFVALSQDYDIAAYIFRNREPIGGRNLFKFSFHRHCKKSEWSAPGFIPKVGCFEFTTKKNVKRAMWTFPFLRPAWDTVKYMSEDTSWLVLLDEDPALVLAEATSAGAKCA